MEKTFIIEGMSCQHCVKAVQLELEEANLSNYEVEVNSAKVKYDTPEDEGKVLSAIKEAGFKVVSFH
jgi:copper chaperone